MIHHSVFIIVGLGNPGEKYEKTRHNAGRTVLRCFAKQHNFPEWEFDKYRNALISEGDVESVRATLVLPETFMNKSGFSVKKNTKDEDSVEERLIIVHDDMDLPIGSLKISHSRGSAGHRGVDSIIDALGTNDFTRVRIGILPVDESGAPRKPQGEGAVNRFVLQRFNSEELEKMKDVCASASEALLMIMREGRERAMDKFN